MLFSKVNFLFCGENVDGLFKLFWCVKGRSRIGASGAYTLIAFNTRNSTYVFYSLLTLRKERVCKRASKQSPTPENSNAPRVLKFLDPPLE